MQFIEQTGIYFSPVHRGHGVYKARLDFDEDKKPIKIENGKMRFDGHYITVERRGVAVAILGSCMAVSNPIPSKLYLWDDNTKNLSPRVTLIEPGQGLFTFPDAKQNNFLLWTLTLA